MAGQVHAVKVFPNPLSRAKLQWPPGQITWPDNRHFSDELEFNHEAKQKSRHDNL
jgi:hypothetical protein